MRVVKGFAVLATLMVVSSSTGFAQSALGETDTYADTEMEGIDPDLVTGVWGVSQDFAGKVIQKINISEEDLGGERAIDDLITLMRITLEFTSEVIDRVRDKDAKTETEMNLTHNETSFIADDERVEEAFQYLRLLQSENLCEEAINKTG